MTLLRGGKNDKYFLHYVLVPDDPAFELYLSVATIR